MNYFISILLLLSLLSCSTQDETISPSQSLTVSNYVSPQNNKDGQNQIKTVDVNFEPSSDDCSNSSEFIEIAILNKDKVFISTIHSTLSPSGKGVVSITQLDNENVYFLSFKINKQLLSTSRVELDFDNKNNVDNTVFYNNCAD
ncbi:hypothetical protein [Flammeovirga kamogawensis]|uniref:Lipoprotein n=1 Tax=Flammeovirga kamogawensis TaxID=373891 RepID=A0ABX8GWR1_9BACT|nr:hypothetical protein [Flammeovirga kamogawensis]MBB6461194.1 outer membrane protein assembly factor BamE (lipoprotein component of BamABCDE complex) [Flammeovirga kamogawensis]QWG07757.1 hypothetical protein KM029_02115 [Flammeovirga kamogawensis]TRX69563.1 hypothetical protein EO216_16050 [Flammeovirga kamogawensis]